jgi:glycosyltransferase involved in cell wall biosynthesis
VHIAAFYSTRVNKKIEHIVIDASEKNTTRELLLDFGYESIDSRRPGSVRCFLSESDEGVYYGMEKGANLANGKYIWFLNDDDYILSTHVSGLIELLESKEPKIVVGSIEYRESAGKTSRSRLFRPNSVAAADLILDGSLRRLPHPATVVRRDLWPGFSLEYSMIADYVALIKALGHCDVTTAYEDLRVAMVRSEAQLSIKYRDIRDSELIAFRSDHLNSVPYTLGYWVRLTMWVWQNKLAVIKGVFKC